MASSSIFETSPENFFFALSTASCQDVSKLVWDRSLFCEPGLCDSGLCVAELVGEAEDCEASSVGDALVLGAAAWLLVAVVGSGLSPVLPEHPEASKAVANANVSTVVVFFVALVFMIRSLIPWEGPSLKMRDFMSRIGLLPVRRGKSAAGSSPAGSPAWSRGARL